jgi:sugar phosphate isomerase/epimerase
LSCNLFSFNQPLRSGAMSLEEAMDFCAVLGFDAVDPTGYYFPGYPSPPALEFINRIKRRAFLQGLDISGTGVRNDFTQAEESLRQADLDLVRKWCGVAAQLGAPLLRVFSGKGGPEARKRPEITEWLVSALKKCCEFGKETGVLIALQNHADFIQTADQLLEVVERVDSDWLGVHLDIGSFTSADPYAEIARCAPFALTWQIKENVRPNGREQKTDLKRLWEIVHSAGYQGYLPLETLGEGDPRQKVPRFLEEVRKTLLL